MILTFLIFFPLLFSVLVFSLPNKAPLIRMTTLVGSLFHFAVTLLMLFQFDFAQAAFQFVESKAWFPQLGIKYHIGIDGLSVWLVALSTFFMPIVVLGSWNAIQKNVKLFHVGLLLLQTSMIGTFLSIDLVLFYLFFEFSLIPMALMIGIWGGEKRIYASLKFFIYTMFGSVLMLAGIITLIFLNQQATGVLSASLTDLYKLDISFIGGSLGSTQTLLFFAFMIALGIKVPLFPFHTWLPDAHVQAPTPGSVYLAAIMLKMGTYGMLRMVVPMFPYATNYWGWIIMGLAIIGIIYGALMALIQTDIKKLVAYSSVSHMGYVVLGIFALNVLGVSGSIYQMLNHGISTGALFLMVGMIYERTHTKKISDYGGLATTMPWFTIFFIIFTMSSIAVPLTNGFIGEFLILAGAFQANMVYGILGVTGVVLGASYMLWMVKKVFFGPTQGVSTQEGLTDLTCRELIILTPLVFLVFLMGIYPKLFMGTIEVFVNQLNL